MTWSIISPCYPDRHQPTYPTAKWVQNITASLPVGPGLTAACWGLRQGGMAEQVGLYLLFDGHSGASAAIGSETNPARSLTDAAQKGPRSETSVRPRSPDDHQRQVVCR